MQSNLPIAAWHRHIVSALETSSYIVVTGEPNAGKSTQIGQYLIAAGYRVTMAQPQRIAAIDLATQVAAELDTHVGGLIGHASASGSTMSSDTRLCFCTDGLPLVERLAGSADVLVIDEIQEGQLNTTTLLAWALREVTRRPAFKVVLVSAPRDGKRLAEYVGGCPVIEIPSHLYPVERHHTGPDQLIPRAVKLARRGHGVLVFAGGKREVRELAARLRTATERGFGHRRPEVFELHVASTLDDHRRILERPEANARRIVVASGPAPHVLTVPGIDCVVDTGLRRGAEVVDGVEVGQPQLASQPDCLDRAKAAGQERPGAYWLASAKRLEEHPEEPQPEITQVSLARALLALTRAGIDIAQEGLFHQPSPAAVQEAKEANVRLGALDEHGRLTELGREMSALALPPRLARMVVEGRRLDVFGDVATIAAIVNSEGIRRPNWQLGVGAAADPRISRSDLLIELLCFRQAAAMTDAVRRDAHLLGEGYRRARAVRDGIIRAYPLARYSAECDPEQVLLACFAGMVDGLYRRIEGCLYAGTDGERKLSLHSVLYENPPEWIVARRKNIVRDGRVLRLLDFATKVDPALLAKADFLPFERP